jgi:hypothetical protein
MPATIGSDGPTKGSSRESNKKGTAKSEKALVEKEKHMRFAATWPWKMTFEDPTNKGKNSSVGLVQSKLKLLPTGT